MIPRVSPCRSCAASAAGTRSGTDLAESEYVDNGAIQSPASYESTSSIANAEETRWFILNKDTLSAKNIVYGAATDQINNYDITSSALE